jgi:anti-sigma B factor antagonist
VQGFQQRHPAQPSSPTREVTMTDEGKFPVETAAGVPVVAVPAELDITNAPRLEPALAEAAGKGHGRFVVDMSRTRFCDCAGLYVLLAAHKKACADGGCLALAVADQAVLRLFELTGARRRGPLLHEPGASPRSRVGRRIRRRACAKGRRDGGPAWRSRPPTVSCLIA